MSAAPALEAARAAMVDLHGEQVEPTMPVRCICNTGHLRTLLAELDRLQRDAERHALLLAATRRAWDECVDLIGTPAGDSLEAALALFPEEEPARV